MVLAKHAISTNKQDAVFNKALLRVTEFLQLSRKEVSAILGVSEATLCRVYAGKKPFELHSNEGSLGLLLIRIFRSLDALLGGNQEQCRLWLRSQNSHLQAIPAEKIKTIAGIVEVANYLDAMRGKA